MRERDQRLEAGCGDREMAVIDVETEETVESAQVPHAGIGERASKREVVRAAAVPDEPQLRFTTVPRS